MALKLVFNPFTGTLDYVRTLDVEDEGISLGNFLRMNFVGAGVTAADAGGGEVTVTIPGGGAGTVDEPIISSWMGL